MVETVADDDDDDNDDEEAIRLVNCVALHKLQSFTLRISHPHYCHGRSTAMVRQVGTSLQR